MKLIKGLLLGLGCYFPVYATATDQNSILRPISYDLNQGIEFGQAEDDNYLWFGVRLQTRYSNTTIVLEQQPGDLIQEKKDFQLNRGRFKLGGHLFSPDLAVYTEYDFPTSRLIDLRASYNFSHYFNLRAGQWKSEFNRERVDSSGAQQFVERSIVTPWFTIDRQVGIVSSGRLQAGSRLDSSYWFGWLSGAGRGGKLDEAEGLWLGRYQWNFTGNVLGFSQSDLQLREAPSGSIAVAAVKGKTAFTSFSSAGGGQLEGFSAGASDRYTLRQLLFETAYQYKGFSWQQEFHWKFINDSETGQQSRIDGGYAQAGFFPVVYFPDFPAALEFAARIAVVRPDNVISPEYEREYTVGTNWFFNGHRNKLSFDISYLESEFSFDQEKITRFRLQWDVSF